MNKYDLLTQLYAPQTEDLLKKLYGREALTEQQKRYRNAIRYFDEQPCWDFCTDLEQIHIYRSPGRSEICGNHTDHQKGEVIAAAIDHDIIAVAAPSDNAVISITSSGFGETSLQLSGDIITPRQEERGTAKALLRGVVAGLLKGGYTVKGFCAFFTGSIPEGAGMSSSAAFENMISCIIGNMFNPEPVPADEIALISQAAENQYYGKPCGLMDQLACATGGLLHMDLRDPASPLFWKLDVDIEEAGYDMCLVDTHGSHRNLTEDYKAVISEMFHVANMFGRDSLRGLTAEDLISHAAAIREGCGDRAFLRAMHFVGENARVRKQVSALKRRDFESFLRFEKESGDSSYKYLQNIYSREFPQEQPLAVCLAVSESVLGDDGVCRVHGGGFSGTIQAFVKSSALDRYLRTMDGIFGPGSCHVIRISPFGCIQVL